MRRLASGGLGPGWAGSAVEGGEVFDVINEVCHCPSEDRQASGLNLTPLLDIGQIREGVAGVDVEGSSVSTIKQRPLTPSPYSQQQLPNKSF